MRFTRMLSLSAVAAAVLASTATAQRPIELGVDGAVIIGTGDDSYTRIALPVGMFRVGFFMTDRTSIEPSLAFNYVKFKDDDDGVTTLEADVGAVYHLQPSRASSQIFIRPAVGISTFSAGDESDSQVNLAIGLGLKNPLMDRLSSRFEARLIHALESGDLPAQTSIALLAGLSFFTR